MSAFLKKATCSRLFRVKIRVNIMKDNFRKIIALSVLLCIPSVASSISYAEGNISYKTGMTQVGIRAEAEAPNLSDNEGKTNDNIQTEENNEDKDVLIEPGEYLIYGAKQMRIADADNRVVLFKGKQSGGEALKAELPQGGMLEYMGKLYMTRIEKAETDQISVESNIERLAINPLVYSPIYSISLFNIASKGYAKITDGTLKVYNKNGELKHQVYVPYISALSGYILNEGIGLNSSAQREELEGEKMLMESGRAYTVGTDLKVSKYLARGKGTVRVYDAEGYIKTVIKLKNSDTPENEGVESYKFSFNANNIVITEGSIELTEIYDETS